MAKVVEKRDGSRRMRTICFDGCSLEDAPNGQGTKLNTMVLPRVQNRNRCALVLTLWRVYESSSQ